MGGVGGLRSGNRQIEKNGKGIT